MTFDAWGRLKEEGYFDNPGLEETKRLLFEQLDAVDRLRSALKNSGTGVDEPATKADVLAVAEALHDTLHAELRYVRVWLLEELRKDVLPERSRDGQ